MGNCWCDWFLDDTLASSWKWDKVRMLVIFLLEGLIDYMSNCVYVLWWKEDVASSRVWGIVGFTFKTRPKWVWGLQRLQKWDTVGLMCIMFMNIVVHYLILSMFNIGQLVLEWYSRIKTSRQGNTQMVDKVRWKETRSKTRSERDQTPPRQGTQPATAILDKY